MKNLELHLHDDISFAAGWYNLPLALWNLGDVYILQEDRLVFVGNKHAAEKFIKLNEGKYCKQIDLRRPKEKD